MHVYTVLTSRRHQRESLYEAIGSNDTKLSFFHHYLQHRWRKRLLLVESLRLSEFENLTVVQYVHLILEELQRRGFTGQSPGDLLPDNLHHL